MAACEPFFEPLPPELANCRLCPRLALHREDVAQRKRRAYQHEEYWGRPVPGFGDLQARLLILGLAPGAHGSNRSGRMFTGDASGDFLFPALHRARLASQPQATARDDGLRLQGVYITAALRCVPPQNKPLRAEMRQCQRWLRYDLEGLPQLRLVLALGAIAHDSYLEYLRDVRHCNIVKARYPFGHGVLHRFDEVVDNTLSTDDTLNTDKTPLPLLDAYHVSFQNTNTGKLSEAMFDALLEQAKTLADLR